VGTGNRRLQCLRDLMESTSDINPEWLYPTHINRSEKLIVEAVAFTKRNCHVDMDVTDGNLHKWLEIYNSCGGNPSCLTISSDAAITSPNNVFNEIRKCLVDHKYKLEEIWPLVSKNTAHILKFKTRGEIKPGFDSSFLMLNSRTFDIDHVVSRGRFMVRDGNLCVKEKFLEESNRRISLIGNKA
jgi:beta-aspartyl-dipeptidase (metallo-type)